MSHLSLGQPWEHFHALQNLFSWGSQEKPASCCSLSSPKGKDMLFGSVWGNSRRTASFGGKEIAAATCSARWASWNKWLSRAPIIVLGSVVRTSFCSALRGCLKLGKIPCNFLPLLHYAAANKWLPQGISLYFVQRLSHGLSPKMLGVTSSVFELSICEILSGALTGGPGRWSGSSGALGPPWFSVLGYWDAVGWSRPEPSALLDSGHPSATGVSCLL